MDEQVDGIMRDLSLFNYSPPTTTSLNALIPGIWAETLIRKLQNDFEAYAKMLEAAWMALPPEVRAKEERKRKNRAHYYRYMAWVKKQPRRKKKACHSHSTKNGTKTTKKS